ncbi:MAG: hypothetical protein Q8P57_00155 [Candidatus Pacearchaeota archaeon]|nr:hypothetical protein [Candidatus Pacearchaeota archaeon]
MKHKMEEPKLMSELMKYWKEVYNWDDEPNEHYIEFGNYNLKQNDRVIIKRGKSHEVKIGVNWCKCIVAEKIK